MNELRMTGLNVKILFTLFITMAKLGCAAYGGGPSVIPLLQTEVVKIRQWMGVEEFMDALAVGNALPGPIATKMSAVVGHRIAGAAGAAAAVLGMVLPSGILVLILLRLIGMVKVNPNITSMLKGLRPVVVAMLAYAAYSMAPSSLRGAMTWCIGIAALLLMIFTKINPVWIIVAGGAAGIILKL
ncbi:MAG: chromate transporter [Synergistaceae bacterium]|jgi:chromate transporter|nr:chromate transporter [Synergistaceae bacterium]